MAIVSDWEVCVRRSGHVREYVHIDMWVCRFWDMKRYIYVDEVVAWKKVYEIVWLRIGEVRTVWICVWEILV